MAISPMNVVGQVTGMQGQNNLMQMANSLGYNAGYFHEDYAAGQAEQLRGGAAQDMPLGDIHSPEGLASLAKGLGQSYGPVHEQATRILWGLESGAGASQEVLQRVADIKAGKYNTVDGPHPLMKLGFMAIMGAGGLSALSASGAGAGAGAGLSAELAAGAPELAGTMGLGEVAAGAGAATGIGASMPPAIVDKAALEEMIALGGTAGGGGAMMPPAVLDPAVFEGAELGGASVLGGLEGFPELGQLALSAGEDFAFSPETFAGSSGTFDFGGSGALGTNFLPGEWDWLEKLKKIKGPISGGMSLLSGFMGLKQSRDLSKLSREAMNRSDPFGPERTKYAQELDRLRQDPSRVERLPGYKAGLQAVERRMASQGYLGSGNMMIALHDYGGRMYDAEANRLAQLAGAGISPNFGPALSAQASSSDLASRALASLGYGARQFLQ